MPTYEFTCTNCEMVFDVNKSMKEVKEEEICPNCGCVAKRKYSATPTVFKCDGFYTTDSRGGE